jgi:hypothetical protein
MAWNSLAGKHGSIAASKAITHPIISSLPANCCCLLLAAEYEVFRNVVEIMFYKN